MQSKYMWHCHVMYKQTSTNTRSMLQINVSLPHTYVCIVDCIVVLQTKSTTCVGAFRNIIVGSSTSGSSIGSRCHSYLCWQFTYVPQMCFIRCMQPRFVQGKTTTTIIIQTAAVAVVTIRIVGAVSLVICFCIR